MAIHGKFLGQGPIIGIQDIHAGRAVAAAIIKGIPNIPPDRIIIIRAGTDDDKPLAPYPDGSRIGCGEAQVVVAEGPEQTWGDFRIGDIKGKIGGLEIEVAGAVTVSIHANRRAAKPHSADQNSPPATGMV